MNHHNRNNKQTAFMMLLKIIILILACALVLFAAKHAQAQQTTFAGVPIIIDGDSLRLDGVEIRLYGIDAPEIQQTCAMPQGRWKCGESAKIFLQNLLKDERIICYSHGQDKYQRLLSLCVWQHVNINALLVSAGLAHAYVRYSTDYIHQQNLAKQTPTGIWQSQHIPPWEYRRR